MSLRQKGSTGNGPFLPSARLTADPFVSLVWRNQPHCFEKVLSLPNQCFKGPIWAIAWPNLHNSVMHHRCSSKINQEQLNTFMALRLAFPLVIEYSEKLPRHTDVSVCIWEGKGRGEGDGCLCVL